MTHRLRSLARLALGVALVGACNDEPPIYLCATGAQVPCACDDGSIGTATCESPVALGPCVCGDTGADGGDGGSDATDADDTSPDVGDTGAGDSAPDVADTGDDTTPGDTSPPDTDATDTLPDDTGQDVTDAGDTADATPDTDTTPDPTCPELPAPDDPYLGCEFWSVDLPVYDDPFTGGPEYPYGVVITNPGSASVDVTFDPYADEVLPPGIATVPARSSTVVELPRLDLSDTGVAMRSMRIVATGHVMVAQYNPLDPAVAASADASLLLPVRSLGARYRVATAQVIPMAGIPGIEPQRAFATVVAVEEGTTNVHVTPSMAVQDGEGITGWSAGVERSFVLARGEVLNLAFAGAAGPSESNPNGSAIVADRPVAAFAGHEQGLAGRETDSSTSTLAGFADHLEIQLPPQSAWGTTYVAAHGPPRGTEKDSWVIVAGTDGTVLSTTPVIAGMSGATLDAGSVLRFDTVTSFVLNASAPVMVAHLVPGQQAWGVTRVVGDPALSVLRPTTEFASELVGWSPAVPDDVLEAWLTIVTPTGASVAVNGEALVGDPQGVGAWAIHRTAARSGTNFVQADAPASAMLTLFTANSGVELPLAGAR